MGGWVWAGAGEVSSAPGKSLEAYCSSLAPSENEQRADLGIVKRPGAYCRQEYRHIQDGSQGGNAEF